jgi:hypothetical protein
VEGSRQYRNFETHFIPAATFQALRTEPLPLAIETELPPYLSGHKRALQEKMTEVAGKAEHNALPDVSLVDGYLIKGKKLFTAVALPFLDAFHDRNLQVNHQTSGAMRKENA